MEYDVVIVGAGPAGFTTGHPAQEMQPDANIVIGKDRPGAHILSGAVMDPRAIPSCSRNWQAQGAPLKQPVTGDDVLSCPRRRPPHA